MKSNKSTDWEKKLSPIQVKIWHKPELVNLSLRATRSGKPHYKETGLGHAAPS